MAISTSDSDKKYRDQTGPGRCSGKQEIYNSEWGKILSLCCVHIYGSSFTTGKNHIPWYLPSEECQFYNRAKTFVWQHHSRDILLPAVRDGHHRLSYKVLSGLVWSHLQCASVDFVGKTDDNVVLDLSTLFANLDTLNTEPRVEKYIQHWYI